MTRLTSTFKPDRWGERISNKWVLRQEMRQLRDSLENKAIVSHSQQITDRILEMEQIQNAVSLFVYISFCSEVVTHRLIDVLVASGKKVLVPYLVDAQNMEAVPFSSWDALHKDQFGILVPRVPQVWKHTIDICITPGLAFSHRGDRLGYGRGYYDRFLSRRQVGLTIGLAFACQLCREIPTDRFDQRMERVVTEDQLLAPSLCPG